MFSTDPDRRLPLLRWWAVWVYRMSVLVLLGFTAHTTSHNSTCASVLSRLFSP